MDADKEAEELLPCSRTAVCDIIPPLPIWKSEHWSECPAYFRPAAAAKLRERDDELSVLKTILVHWDPSPADADGNCDRCGLSWKDGIHRCPSSFWNRYEQTIAGLRVENQQLRTENARWKHCYELRGAALQRPCLSCGYVPKEIST